MTRTLEIIGICGIIALVTLLFFGREIAGVVFLMTMAALCIFEGMKAVFDKS